MKRVLLAIFVFIASLPVEASSCDMHGSGGAVHGQHGDMIDHGQMDMDCCDQGEPDTPCDCGFLKHCGAAASGIVTVDNSPVNITHINGHTELTGDSARVLSRYGSPPFRPPIA
jgi:hypothetical protein